MCAGRCIQTYVQKWGEGGDIPPMVHCIKLCVAAHYADLPAANISLANLSGHPESRHPLITDAVIRCLQLLTQPPHQSHDEGHQAIRSDLLSSIRRAIATLARLPVPSQEEPRSSSAATDLLDGTAATQPGLYLVQICASVLDCKVKLQSPAKPPPPDHHMHLTLAFIPTLTPGMPNEMGVATRGFTPLPV